MWDIIIGLFYRRSCRKHLTGMRKYRWNLAPANTGSLDPGPVRGVSL
jgi:hypothetical protein